jgi:hypothetical protein
MTIEPSLKFNSEAGNPFSNPVPHFMQKSESAGLSQLHCLHASLSQFLEERLGILEIGDIETFGERVIDSCKLGPGLITVSTGREQPGEAGRSTQLPSLCAYSLRMSDRFTVVSLCILRLPKLFVNFAAHSKGHRQKRGRFRIRLNGLLNSLKCVVENTATRLGSGQIGKVSMPSGAHLI